MTQNEHVAELLKQREYSIKELHEKTGILRPNIRRILGQGAVAGQFQRVARGVYILKDQEKQIAWIECGCATDVLKDFAEAGQRFDMIFLDPAYYSKNLTGGNRLQRDAWYKFITPRQFYRCMESIKRLVADDNTHVYLMLSGAPGTQKEMKNYLTAAQLNGFQVAGNGTYLKTYASGKPVINIQGEENAGEHIYLLNKTGQLLQDCKLSFTLPRPDLNNSYRTEKPAVMINQLIRQSTSEGEHVLDPFAGSGVTGQEALKLKRRVTLVELAIEAVETFILRRIKPFSYSL